MGDKITLPSPKERNIFFSEQVTQSSIKDIIEKIININDNDEYLTKIYAVEDLVYKPKPIKIYIDSYGGLVYQILGLVSIVEKSKTEIHTICTGTAISSGFILLICGHKRFAYSNSTVLYHQLSCGAVGKIQDVEEEYFEAKKLQTKLEDITIKHTNITQEQLDDNRKHKIDWFMTADEAKKLKVIDKII